MKRKLLLVSFVAIFALLNFSQGLQMFEREHNRKVHSLIEQVRGFDPEKVLVVHLNDEAADFASEPELRYWRFRREHNRK